MLVSSVILLIRFSPRKLYLYSQWQQCQHIYCHLNCSKDKNIDIVKPKIICVVSCSVVQFRLLVFVFVFLFVYFLSSTMRWWNKTVYMYRSQSVLELTEIKLNVILFHGVYFSISYTRWALRETVYAFSIYHINTTVTVRDKMKRFSPKC